MPPLYEETLLYMPVSVPGVSIEEAKTPALGAVLMSASTVVVAINAQLLKRVEL